MTEIVARINLDGSLVTLSGSGAEEVLDLRTFGPMEVKRASNVLFDHDTQLWGWKSVDGCHSGSGFALRQYAVNDEIKKLSAIL